MPMASLDRSAVHSPCSSCMSGFVARLSGLAPASVNLIVSSFVFEELDQARGGTTGAML